MNNTSSLQRFHLFIWRYYYAVSAIGTTCTSQYVQVKLIFLYSSCSFHFQFVFSENMKWFSGNVNFWMFWGR